jgi:UDP-N-acetylglucosamine 1-carboxyvinyltransferase
MSKLIINGGKPLRGTVTPVANKNSILKIIPACILTDEDVTLHNVPKSSSVTVMLQVFKQLGGEVTYHRDGSITLNASSINKSSINEDLANKERATFMFLGPLLARFGKAEISDPGGCKLGNRPLDAMFQGLKALGVNLDKEDGYKLSTNGLKGCTDIWLIEASVTGTENLILAAVKAKGQTMIYGAACEPHTQDLCNFLVSLGAKISGIGTNRLTIDGVESLSGGQWTIIPDHIDIGGWIVAAAVTGGELLIKNAIPHHMTQVLNYFEKLNLKVEIRGEDIFVPAKQNLICNPNIRGDIDRIFDQPWPGFPVDLIPQALVLATKAKGSAIISSRMYETQLFFIEELQRMKATIIMADPHRVIVMGPAHYKGNTISAPNILQSTHALLLASLSAEGKTTLLNADMLFRRYPGILETLQGLGADVSIDK